MVRVGVSVEGITVRITFYLSSSFVSGAASDLH